MLSSMLFSALTAALSLTFENAAPASARSLTGRLTGPGSDLENSYIIKLKDGVNTTSHINSLPFSFSIEDESSPITHFWPEFFVGYSGIFVGADLDAITASPDVEYVEKNGIVRFMALSLASHILNHMHRSAALITKPTHHGTCNPSAPDSLSAERTRTRIFTPTRITYPSVMASTFTLSTAGCTSNTTNSKAAHHGAG
jgi:hypothetical protein